MTVHYQTQHHPRLRAKALVVGGTTKHFNAHFEEALRRNWEIEVLGHWPVDGRVGDDIPKGTNLIIFFTNWASHSQQNSFLPRARACGIPILFTISKWAILRRDLIEEGFTETRRLLQDEPENDEPENDTPADLEATAQDAGDPEIKEPAPPTVSPKPGRVRTTAVHALPSEEPSTAQTMIPLLSVFTPYSATLEAGEGPPPAPDDKDDAIRVVEYKGVRARGRRGITVSEEGFFDVFWEFVANGYGKARRRAIFPIRLPEERIKEHIDRVLADWKRLDEQHTPVVEKPPAPTKADKRAEKEERRKRDEERRRVAAETREAEAKAAAETRANKIRDAEAEAAEQTAANERYMAERAAQTEAARARKAAVPSPSPVTHNPTPEAPPMSKTPQNSTPQGSQMTPSPAPATPGTAEVQGPKKATRTPTPKGPPSLAKLVSMLRERMALDGVHSIQVEDSKPVEVTKLVLQRVVLDL